MEPWRLAWREARRHQGHRLRDALLADNPLLLQGRTCDPQTGLDTLWCLGGCPWAFVHMLGPVGGVEEGFAELCSHVDAAGGTTRPAPSPAPSSWRS